MLITNREKKKIPHAPPQRHTHSADRRSPSYLTCSPAHLARSPAYLDRRVRSRSVQRRALLARVHHLLPGVPHVLARVHHLLSGVPRSTRLVAIGPAPCSARPRPSLAPRRTSRLARVHHLLAREPRSTRLVAIGSAPSAARRRPSLARPLLAVVPRACSSAYLAAAGSAPRCCSSAYLGRLTPVPHRGLPLG